MRAESTTGDKDRCVQLLLASWPSLHKTIRECRLKYLAGSANGQPEWVSWTQERPRLYEAIFREPKDVDRPDWGSKVNTYTLGYVLLHQKSNRRITVTVSAAGVVEQSGLGIMPATSEDIRHWVKFWGGL